MRSGEVVFLLQKSKNWKISRKKKEKKLTLHPPLLPRQQQWPVDPCTAGWSPPRAGQWRARRSPGGRQSPSWSLPSRTAGLLPRGTLPPLEPEIRLRAAASRRHSPVSQILGGKKKKKKKKRKRKNEEEKQKRQKEGTNKKKKEKNNQSEQKPIKKKTCLYFI